MFLKKRPHICKYEYSHIALYIPYQLWPFLLQKRGVEREVVRPVSEEERTLTWGLNTAAIKKNLKNSYVNFQMGRDLNDFDCTLSHELSAATPKSNL